MCYFHGNKDHPQHLSVGAVVVNEEGEVCAHYMTSDKLGGYWADEGIDDVYMLMRKTPRPRDSLEVTVHRGVMEEFGIEGEILDYVGSHKGHFVHDGVSVEKTTLYFLVQMQSHDLSKRKTDDGDTGVVWERPEVLIRKMREQSKRYDRTDIDESEVIESLVERGLLKL